RIRGVGTGRGAGFGAAAVGAGGAASEGGDDGLGGVGTATGAGGTTVVAIGLVLLAGWPIGSRLLPSCGDAAKRTCAAAAPFTASTVYASACVRAACAFGLVAPPVGPCRPRHPVPTASTAPTAPTARHRQDQR